MVGERVHERERESVCGGMCEGGREGGTLASRRGRHTTSSCSPRIRVTLRLTIGTVPQYWHSPSLTAHRPAIGQAHHHGQWRLPDGLLASCLNTSLALRHRRGAPLSAWRLTIDMAPHSGHNPSLSAWRPAAAGTRVVTACQEATACLLDPLPNPQTPTQRPTQARTGGHHGMSCQKSGANQYHSSTDEPRQAHAAGS